MECFRKIIIFSATLVTRTLKNNSYQFSVMANLEHLSKFRSNEFEIWHKPSEYRSFVLSCLLEIGGLLLLIGRARQARVSASICTNTKLDVEVLTVALGWMIRILVSSTCSKHIYEQTYVVLSFCFKQSRASVAVGWGPDQSQQSALALSAAD